MPSTSHPSGLPLATIDSLRLHAERAAENAYAPYSNFRVGAALLLHEMDETPVTGCNVEVNSYRLTTCAEQGAIAQAVARYGPGIKIRAIAIANLNQAPCAPCGACRQAILEFSGAGTWVFFPGEAGALEGGAISDLLPSAFRLE